MKFSPYILLIITIIILFTNSVESQNNCEKYMNLVFDNGIELNQVSPISSTMIAKAYYYSYNNNNYVIAYLKSRKSYNNGNPYLFCGISQTLWNQFTSQGSYGSYGEAFHTYIMDRKCDCSSWEKNNFFKGINTTGGDVSSIGHVLREKENRWNNNQKKYTDYYTNGFLQISNQLNDTEKVLALNYFEEGLQIYWNNSLANIDFSNSNDSRLALRQIDKVLSFVIEKLNVNKIESSNNVLSNNNERKEILYKTKISHTKILPIRIAPNSKSETVATIKENDIIHVIDTINIPDNYIKVLSNDKIGFINKIYTEYSNPNKNKKAIQFESLVENTGSYFTEDVREYSWDSNNQKWILTLTDSGTTYFNFEANLIQFKRQHFLDWKVSTYLFIGLDNETGGYLLEDFYGSKIIIDIDFETVIWFSEKNDQSYTKMYRYNNLQKK